jgi:8-oxo-dGTP pyrophosphatase MutT (NUDIX family)
MHILWPALAAARRQTQARTAFHIDGTVVGSVASAHLAALQRWPGWITTDARGLHLVAPAAGRDHALAEINARLRRDGLVVAWRDEAFPLYEPASGAVLAIFERAACRFWGTLTRGAHCTGFVAGADGQPTDLWIARRAPTKATDPGKRDNLIGGGVPHGQTPQETLVREGWEEAGLTQDQMAPAQAGRIIRIDCDVPEGRMVEDIHVFDLALPAHVVPQNQDGEVSEITRMAPAQAAACAAAGEMTTDAALVTLDFLLRHKLLPADTAPGMAEEMHRLYKV